MPCALALAFAPAAHAQAPPDFVGITSEDLLYAPGQDRSSTMNQQHSVGVRLIRQVFDWSGIEQSPGHYDFSLYDTFVLDAAAKGIAVLPVLHNPPQFYWRVSTAGAARASAPGAHRDSYRRWPSSRARPCGATGRTARCGASTPGRPACRCAPGRSGTSPTWGSTGATGPTRASTRACCAS